MSEGVEEVEGTEAPEGQTEEAHAGEVEETNEGAAAGGSDDVEKIKSEARKWEKRSKTNFEELKKAREELAKLKGDGETGGELAQLQKQVQDLLAENAAAKREAAIAKVASDKKLTSEQAELLQGDTPEELEAHADKLLKAFGGNADKKEDQTPPKGSRTPKENLRPGTAVGSTANAEDPAEIAKAVMNGL